LNIRE